MDQERLKSQMIKSTLLTNMTPPEMIQFATDINTAVFDCCAEMTEWTVESIANMLTQPVAWKVNTHYQEMAFWWRQFNPQRF